MNSDEYSKKIVIPKSTTKNIGVVKKGADSYLVADNNNASSFLKMTPILIGCGDYVIKKQNGNIVFVSKELTIPEKLAMVYEVVGENFTYNGGTMSVWDVTGGYAIGS